jgi:hypothetical protein
MNEEPEATDRAGGALSAVSDTLGDLTGIPAPIRKNAFTAFARLCTAAVDYPVALIEGAVAEKRAESKARVRLINASASQIAKQMRTDPEYARAAATKFAHKIIRERVNLDQVSEIAAADLKSEPLTTGTEQLEAPPISEDWLNVFESEAAHMSSEQMQYLFGKILAGEIRRPTSYSIRTIKLVAQLDNSAAAWFRLLCSLSISLRVPHSNMIIDARVVSLGGDAGSNSMKDYGITFHVLNILQEYGLIISDYNSYMGYSTAVMDEGEIAPSMIYQNAQWALMPKVAPPLNEPFRQTFDMHGVAFSRAGTELLPVVAITPNDQYTEALNNFFDQQGMTMTRVGLL